VPRATEADALADKILFEELFSKFFTSFLNEKS
jgi:hypothetical protein